MSSLDDAVRHSLNEFGGLTVAVDTLTETDDLYRLGLSSHASVNVMLALEDEFDVEFPDSLLTKSTFQSVENIRGALLSAGAATDEH